MNTSTDTVVNPTPPEEAFKKLDALNHSVRSRFDQVKSSFDGSELDPTKTAAFKKFVAEHLALHNMWYVTTGQFKDMTVGDGSENPSTVQDKKMKEAGFAVSDSSGRSHVLDPMLVGNPAALAAVRDGAFDDDDDKNEPELLGPKAK